MKRYWLTLAGSLFLSMIALILPLYVLQAAPRQATPTVAQVDPPSAPNDLDTTVTISGTGFEAGAAVYLGSTAAESVTRLSTTKLEAVIPWGLTSGVYTLTVTNPGGASGGLADAFTVTQGIGVWNATELYGGSVSELAINPVTPTVLHAASENVGLFSTQDGAAHWTYDAAGAFVHGLTIAPSDPDTLYVSLIGQPAAGLHRSDDGGATWTPLNAPGDSAYPHPTDPNVVYVSKSDGTSGIWRSEDRGLTWTPVITGLTDTQITVVAFHPTDPMTMVAGTVNGNLFVSPNGGDTWSFIDQPTDFIQALAVNPRGDHELWVSNCCFCSSKETLKSTNADHTTWAPVAAPVGANSMRTIAFPPEAWGGDVYSNTVFVNSCWGEAHRTDDGGAAWAPFGPTTGDWALALHPSDPDIVYRSSSWEGVIKTTDGGASWQVANEGLTALTPNVLEAVSDQPGTLFAATDRSDGIYKATRGGETWQFVTITGSWSIGSLLVDPTTPTRVYAGRGDPQDRVFIEISNDGGETWPTRSTISVTGAYTGCPNFVNALTAHPSQPDTLLLGMEHFCMGVPGIHDGDLYRSTDAGLSWDLAAVSGTATISPVKAIAYDALTPTIVYAATGIWDMGSGVLRSMDGGETWERIGESIPALDYVKDLAVEGHPPYRIYAWTGAPTGIYVSADHGESWAQADAPLAGFQVEELQHTTGNGSALYAAASQSWMGPGLYRSDNGARSWERALGALGHVPIYSLATITDTDRTLIYAGTTGGYVDNRTQALSGAGADTLLNAGVYRLTMRTTPTIFLPLVTHVSGP